MLTLTFLLLCLLSGLSFYIGYATGKDEILRNSEAEASICGGCHETQDSAPGR